MIGTRHAANCRAAYGRKDPDCPRCQELLNGAPARSWATQHSPAFSADHYCFCAHTSPSADRCPSCGKRPYTD